MTLQVAPIEPSTAPKAWYKPGVSIQEFHNDKSRIRAIIGGRGCGKTTGDSVEATRHCWQYPGAKVVVVRKFKSANEDTTLSTFNDTYANCGYIDSGDGTSLFKMWDGGKKVRLPSADAVRRLNKYMKANPKAKKGDIKAFIEGELDKYCSYIIFVGLKDDTHASSTMRGLEYSMLILVEADELEEKHVALAMGSQRYKDAYGKHFNEYPIIIDTNPPSPRHWIADWEYNNPKKFDSMRFWHITCYENAHNLPPNYIRDSVEAPYRNDPSGWDRYVLGKYAEYFSGSPVLYAFDEQLHVVEDLAWPRGAYLVRGWDYGGSNCATVLSAYFMTANREEYFWDIAEVVQENTNIDLQCQAVLAKTLEILGENLHDKDICAGVWDYGDIAHRQKTATGSVLEVMATYNLHPMDNTLGLEDSLAKYNRFLQKTYDKMDEEGNPIKVPAYFISKTGCPRLYLSSRGEYRYPEPGEPGYNSIPRLPLKGPVCNNADHVVDCARYSKAGVLRLLKQGQTTLRKVSNKVNPRRTW